jgi:hypothetical protein
MLTRTHFLSRRQKQFLLVGIALAVVAFGALIYGYERYYRGPSDTILVGTWQMTMPYGMDSATWVKLGPDHIAIWFSDSIAGYQEDFRSRWFAAGPYIYMRYEGKRMIWQIIEILPNELKLRGAKQDHIFKRVTREPPQASNQAMERTTTRSAFVSNVATIFLLRSTLALGGRRSSCSR